LRSVRRTPAAELRRPDPAGLDPRAHPRSHVRHRRRRQRRHILLAADATDTLEQLHARRPDAITPDPDVQVQTIDRILAHATDHPTIYLPTHDPDAVARLDTGTTL